MTLSRFGVPMLASHQSFGASDRRKFHVGVVEIERTNVGRDGATIPVWMWLEMRRGEINPTD
jgi:hypothetical protein